jgi:hypothetical protein
MESDFSRIFVAVWSCPPAPPLPSASPFALPHKAGSFGEARLWVVAFRARRSRYRIRYCALRRQRRDQRDHSTEALMPWPQVAERARARRASSSGSRTGTEPRRGRLRLSIGSYLCEQGNGIAFWLL